MNSWCVDLRGGHVYALNGVCRGCGHYDENQDQTEGVIL